MTPQLGPGARRCFDEAILQSRRRNVERIGDDDVDLAEKHACVSVKKRLAERWDEVADSEAALGLFEAAVQSQQRVVDMFEGSGDEPNELCARAKLANLHARIAAEPEPFPDANLRCHPPEDRDGVAVTLAGVKKTLEDQAIDGIVAQLEASGGGSGGGSGRGSGGKKSKKQKGKAKAKQKAKAKAKH